MSLLKKEGGGVGDLGEWEGVGRSESSLSI